MRFSAITSATLLLLPLATAQFAVRARSVYPDSGDLSAREVNDLPERDTNQLYARAPVLSQHEIQQAQDHIKAQELRYNQANGDLDWYHKNRGTHPQLAQTHTTMARLAQDISNTRHHVNNNHPAGKHEGHTKMAVDWGRQAKSHDKFAASHTKAAGGSR